VQNFPLTSKILIEKSPGVRRIINRMETNLRQCIVRDSSNSAKVSVGMNLKRAIKEAQSGKWGSQCQIEEIYLFEHNFPYLLRVIANYSEHRGFQIIEIDPVFNRFLRNNDIVLPHSTAIDYLKTQITNQSTDCKTDA